MTDTPSTAAELETLIARANSGAPQFIEGERPCVLISLAEFQRLTGRANGVHLGRWLVENAPRLGDIDLPPRSKDRPIPFDEWDDEEVGG